MVSAAGCKMEKDVNAFSFIGSDLQIISLYI
jgi:hypothetical protein